MPKQLYVNNASTKLTAPLSNVGLSFQVTTGEGAKFPNPTGGDWFLITLAKVVSGIETAHEIVKVTTRTDDIFTIVRAQEGTTALIWAVDDWVQLRVTAAKATEVEDHLINVTNPHSVTKIQVGLGSVDNTADADKPVSTAQATAIGLKFDKTGGVITGDLTINTGADSRTLIQVSGVTQGQFQATASAIRLASNNAIPLVLSTNGVDRISLDSAGNITYGTTAASGIHTFKTNSTGDAVVIECTDASASAAPDFVLYRNSDSPAVSDQLGVIVWRGKDSGAADQQYARIGTQITDPTAASEDSELWFETTVAGSAVERLRLTAGGITVTGAVNKVTLTTPATGSTITVADGKTLTASNSLTLAGTDGSTLNIGTGGTLGTAAYTAASTYVAATGSDAVVTRQMFKDCGLSYYDSATANALDYVNGSCQRWAPNTGAQTLSITNWPPTGNLGELLIQGVNLGAATITWPTINWVKSDGTFTTTFSSNGVTLQTSGTDFVFLWTRDAGTTIYGKVIR